MESSCNTRKRENSDDRKLKVYFAIEVGAEFFDFGGLKWKISMVPGFVDEYDGTDDERKKR